MRIIYLSTVCSQKRFDQLVSEGRVNSSFQNQKFHHLILEGMSLADVQDVRVVSYYAVLDKSVSSFQEEFEDEEGITYHYPSFTKKPIDGFLSRIMTTYKAIKKWYNKDSIIICNVMNFEACIAARIFRMFHKIKIIAIVADVPGKTSKVFSINKELPVYKRYLSLVYVKIKDWICIRGKNNYDAYVLLTKAMNEVINLKKRPYIVMEGLSDIKSKNPPTASVSKNEKFTIMYAGGIKKEYGAELMVEAFRQLPYDDIELHVYGYGSYVKKLEEISKEDPRIKYFGTKSNKEIVAFQKKAHLLINPRPTNQEFVKYSFPSKIIECMASGTPLLTTVIPGMPEEYYPYVFFIENECLDGYVSALKDTVLIKQSELSKKGEAARNFIFDKKNNIVQAGRILAFSEKICYCEK